MTWSYLGVPGTTSAVARKDAVRFFLKDTVSSRPLISDEEIAFLLASNGDNVYRATADGARQIASREAKSKSVGDLSIAGYGETYLAMAHEYDNRADSQATPFAGGISIADKDARVLDSDRVQPAFTRSLMETPGVVGSSQST